MKRSKLMLALLFVPVWCLLLGCAGDPVAGSEPGRDTLLHSTVGGLQQAEMRSSAETSVWASAGDVGLGLVLLPIHLVVDVVCLPADIWRECKKDLEKSRHKQELGNESDPWYETVRGAGKEE